MFANRYLPNVMTRHAERAVSTDMRHSVRVVVVVLMLRRWVPIASGYKGCFNGQIANVFESNRCCYDVLNGYIFMNTMLHKTSFLLIFLIPFLLYLVSCLTIESRQWMKNAYTMNVYSVLQKREPIVRIEKSTYNRSQQCRDNYVKI